MNDYEMDRIQTQQVATDWPECLWKNWLYNKDISHWSYTSQKYLNTPTEEPLEKYYMSIDQQG